MITTSKKDRQEYHDTEEVLAIFDKKVREAVKAAGIKETNYMPEGFEFRYKGKTIEVKVTVKK